MKIRFTYGPKDKQPQSWELDPEDLDNLEAEALEVVGGSMWDSYGQWFLLLTKGNSRAIRALLWMLQKRTDPLLDFNEVKFRTSEIEVAEVETTPVGKDGAEGNGTGSPSATLDSPPDSESSTDGPSVSSTQPASG